MLTPGLRKHKLKWLGVGQYSCWRCETCGKSTKHNKDDKATQQAWWAFHKEPCSRPRPIDTDDWNVAMEWRDKVPLDSRADFVAALEEIWRIAAKDDSLCFEDWLATRILAKHYIIAACLCKEKQSVN